MYYTLRNFMEWTTCYNTLVSLTGSKVQLGNSIDKSKGQKVQHLKFIFFSLLVSIMIFLVH